MMMIKRVSGLRLYLLAGAVMAMSAACVRRPDGVLSDKDMVSLVADMELAEAYVQTGSRGAGEEERAALVDYVIKKHGLTREEFDTTMAWYGRNVDAYYDLCESVEAELARRKGKLTGSFTVQSSDLWPYSRQSFISRKSSSDAFMFSIPVVEVQKGERIELKLRMRDRIDATALLGVEYDNGVKEFQNRTLTGVQRLRMVLQTDTGHSVSRIFGNMLLNDMSQTPLWIDSISLSSLPFDSLEYYNIHSQRIYREPKERRRPKAEIPDSLAD